MKNPANTRPTRRDPVFFLPSLEPGMHEAEITGEEASHALRARRLRVGDGIVLTNGRGIMAEASITATRTRPDSVQVSLQQTVERAATNPSLVLATALPKGERLSTMLDMTTQLGMAKIIPLQCDYSVVSYQPRMQERWMRIITNACKQSRRAWLPEIGPSISPGQLLEQASPGSLILYGDHNARDQGQPPGSSRSLQEIIVMVGPEAGFSAAELDTLQQSPRTLELAIGQHILRTETAAVAMLSLAGQLRQGIALGAGIPQLHALEYLS